MQKYDTKITEVRWIKFTYFGDSDRRRTVLVLPVDFYEKMFENQNMCNNQFAPDLIDTWYFDTHECNAMQYWTELNWLTATSFK